MPCTSQVRVTQHEFVDFAAPTLVCTAVVPDGRLLPEDCTLCLGFWWKGVAYQPAARERRCHMMYTKLAGARPLRTRLVCAHGHRGKFKGNQVSRLPYFANITSLTPLHGTDAQVHREETGLWGVGGGMVFERSALRMRPRVLC